MPLELSDGEFRALAARVVDLAAAHLDSLDERSIMPGVSGSEAIAALGGDIP